MVHIRQMDRQNRSIHILYIFLYIKHIHQCYLQHSGNINSYFLYNTFIPSQLILQHVSFPAFFFSFQPPIYRCMVQMKTSAKILMHFFMGAAKRPCDHSPYIFFHGKIPVNAFIGCQERNSVIKDRRRNKAASS